MGQMLERKFYLYALLVFSLTACAGPAANPAQSTRVPATATLGPAATVGPQAPGQLQLIEFFASV